MFWTLLGRRPPRTRRHRTCPVGPLECLERRLVPDASFFRLANGPFLQNWSTAPVQADNDWSTVPSIVGYRGDGLAPAPGTDPQTVLAGGTDTPVTVLANQTDPSSLPPGGIAEFSYLSKPTVALSGDPTSQAPFLLLNLDTRETRNVHVRFDLRDLVLPPSGGPQPFALQYRVGTSGSFTNLATGFVADATNGPYTGNLVTPVSITLPGETDDQPQVQVRILTTNPATTARWIGVDSIQVTAAPAPLAFVIDTANSSLTLSGDVNGSPIQQQGPGSLTTKYTGTVAAVWDRVAGTINFLGAGTEAVALNSGSWQPLAGGGSGSAPANYGGQVQIVLLTAKAAVRELRVSASTASPLSLIGPGPTYTFASAQTFLVTHGFADYNAGLFGSGREDLSGGSDVNTSATQSTLEDMGSGTYRLTLPIDLMLTASTPNLTAHLHIKGTVVANVTTPVNPALPVVDLNGPGPGADNLAGFVQGGPAVAVAPNLTVTRTPPANLTSAFVTLTNRPDGAAESLAVDVGGSGLTASYDPASGRLTVSGTAALSVYQAVLRTVTYTDTADASTMTPGNRLIEFTVTDGTNYSPVRTAVVTVAAPRAPLVNAVPPDQATAVETPLTFSSAGGNGISVSDPNAVAVNIVQVMLSVSNGTLTLAGTSGLTIVAGDNGTATITIRGTLADINAALDGLVYTPNPGFSGNDVLTILSDDLRDTDATGTVQHQTSLGTVAILVQ